MPVETLIDSGAILALVDRHDNWHHPCSATFSELLLPLLTSHAILTEAFHLANHDARESRAVWTLIRSGAIVVGEISQRELPSLEALMAKYHDHPMDYADATLVYLAERESLATVFTVDHDDFETYRIAGRKRFRIVPARHAMR